MARKMRQSGVDWIGEIPEGWEVKRFKHVVTSLRKGNGITKEDVFADGDLPCVRYGEIYSRYGFTVDHCASKTRRSLLPDPVFVVSGDILFACTGELVEEIGKNVLYRGNQPCAAGGDIMVASHNQHPAFLNYYLNCHSSQFQKSRNKAKLKVVHIKTSDIENLLVLLPPLCDQERIAKFLDERCSEIESIVVQTNASIEDYKALKKTFVFEAVTGKNLNGKKVASGQDWLGEIPAAWDVVPVKYLLTEVNSRSESGTEEPLSMSQVLGIVPSSMINVANPAASFIGAKKVSPGDLVFNKLKAHLGVFAVSSYEGLVSPDYAVYRSTSLSDVGYLSWLFHSTNCIDEFRRHVRGVGQGLSRLYSSDLFAIKVPLPPLEEQKRIADMLDEKCGEIDAVVADKERLIADLETYKKSLIFEVVTGKREVA